MGIKKPIVSLHGNGEHVTLSNLSAEWVLMQGATGLGWGPQEITTAALPAGGSILRHRRTTEVEVVIPLLLGAVDPDARAVQRRTLERLCDGAVEVRVDSGDGDYRSRYGYYKDGLQGDYGSGEDSPDGQKLALTFLCPDPTWYGPVRETVRALDGVRKPFLARVTGQDGDGHDLYSPPFFPVILSSSTVEGAFVFDIAGDAEAWPTWVVDGPGEDLLIENRTTGDRIFVAGSFDEQVTIVTRPQMQDVTSPSHMDGSLWDRVAVDSVLFPLAPGRNEVAITMVGASAKTQVQMTYQEAWKAGY